MIVEAKCTTAGMTKGKRYKVFEEIKGIRSYKIILDDGTPGVRHSCGFNVVEDQPKELSGMSVIFEFNDGSWRAINNVTKFRLCEANRSTQAYYEVDYINNDEPSRFICMAYSVLNFILS